MLTRCRFIAPASSSSSSSPTRFLIVKNRSADGEQERIPIFINKLMGENLHQHVVLSWRLYSFPLPQYRWLECIEKVCIPRDSTGGCGSAGQWSLKTLSPYLISYLYRPYTLTHTFFIALIHLPGRIRRACTPSSF